MNPKTEPFDKYSKRYDEWFDRNKFIYKTELKAIKHFIPKKGEGIEIGVGSGKFSVPLDIKFGVDPSKEMRKLTEQRGIIVYNGEGESLDFKDKRFDYVLMVTTICFLNDIRLSFKEVKRVLNDKGKFIIGFIDLNSDLGKEYKSKKEENIFYKDAVFHSATEVISLLMEIGFENIEVIQTIFGKLKNISNIQDFKKGYGQGGFVVIKAEK